MKFLRGLGKLFGGKAKPPKVHYYKSKHDKLRAWRVGKKKRK